MQVESKKLWKCQANKLGKILQEEVMQEVEVGKRNLIRINVNKTSQRRPKSLNKKQFSQSNQQLQKNNQLQKQLNQRLLTIKHSQRRHPKKRKHQLKRKSKQPSHSQPSQLHERKIFWNKIRLKKLRKLQKPNLMILSRNRKWKPSNRSRKRKLS